MTVNEGPRWATLLAPPQALPGAAGRGPGSPAVALALSGTVGAADVGALCAEVATLLAGAHGGLVVCDLGALTGSGLAAVEALARLKLILGGLGHRIQFCRVPRELLELLVLTGLDEVLPTGGAVDHSGGAVDL